MKKYFFRNLCIAALAFGITAAWTSDKQAMQLHTTIVEHTCHCKDDQQATTKQKNHLFHQYLYNAQD